jgi:AraC-like DNA-binding protein
MSPGARRLSPPIVPFIRESEYAVRPPWRLVARRLLDYLLVGVQAGTCRLVVEGVEHELTPGDFALVQPGELHSFEAQVGTTTPYVHFDIFWNPQREESFATPGGRVDLRGYEHLLQPRLSDVPNARIPTRFRPAQGSRFRDVFLELVHVSQQDDEFHRLQSQAVATELVALLLRDFALPAREARSTSSLHWMRSYMSLRLADDLGVDDLAKRAHLSPSRFATLFKREFGLPPHTYLTHLRVDNARSLLSETDAPQDEIARLCGFADTPHFSRTFRRVTGSTPGAYRRSHRPRLAA